MPSSTRQIVISRALPTMSAAAHSTGWTMAKVKANTAEKPAALAMLTPKSWAICGSTGSSARPERLAANVVSAMMLRAGGSEVVVTRGVLGLVLGQRVERHQPLH